MRRRWLKKGVNLALLSERVESFFRSKDFRTKRVELEHECIISATPRRIGHVNGKISVRILGNSNDFMIDVTSSEMAHSSILLGLASTFIGGGNLILRGVRLQERLEELERDFWVHVEDAIICLVNSAKRP